MFIVKECHQTLEVFFIELEVATTKQVSLKINSEINH